MKFHSRQIVALDIQDRYVKCIQIKGSSRSWEIGRVLQRDILPADTPESLQNQWAHTIKSLLQEMGLYPPKNLVTCISGRKVPVKLLKLPSLTDRPPGDKEAMVKYELMSILPVNIDQMSYDYRIIEEDHNQTKAIAAAAKRSTLNRHLKTLSLAGIYGYHAD